ncbi:MAG TPA: DNA polymerase III subunit gamma/tau [Acidimicrobiia bacterium]|nr:DNA polymerase III subunit gamma/tau [Acidimicrobiia bacterium]
MDYQALYRRYRPQTFDDVIGQTHVTTTLAREVADGHVAHAYLFAGPRGTGKTTTARILAKALNCEKRNPDGSPDNTCGSCVAITEGSSLDVMELDAASHNSVEDIREMRVSVSTVASAAAGRRVFILDEAHMLSKAAGNALLKTLEEPPEHVHFVLATTEPYKLLDTIRSRSQRFDFHAVPIEGLAAHLSKVADLEGFKTEPAALVAVARHAGGSVRDSLSLLEQVAALGNGTVDLVGVGRALGLADAEAFEVLTEAVADQDARKALELVARMASQGVDLRRFASEAVGFFRGVFLAHYAPNLAEVADEAGEVLESWRRGAARLPAGEVVRAVDVLGDALVKLREGREERLMLELAMIKLTRPETSTDPAAVLSRLDRLERMAKQPATAIRSAAPATEEPVRQETVAPPEPISAAPAAAADIPDLEAARPLVEDPPAPAPPAAVSMEQFRSIWPGLFGGLREMLGARRWALFRETEPGGVEGSTLVIHVRHDFHLASLRGDPAVAAVVATKAGDLLGGTVAVDFRSVDGMSDAPPTGAADEVDEGGDVPDKHTMEEAPSDPTDPFKLVADELGGVVIDEDES